MVRATKNPASKKVRFIKVFPLAWQLEKPKARALKTPCDAFIENVKRSIRLIELIPLFTWLSAEFQSAFCVAILELTGELKDPPEEILDDVVTKAFKILRHNAKLRGAEAPDLNEEAGLNMIDLIEKLDTGYINTSLRTIFEASLISIWTAFETLAGDLWVTAVNAKPHLAIMEGLPKRITGPLVEPAIDDQQKKTPERIKLVDISTFTDKTFDLRHKMGDILRQSELVRFDSLRSIRYAYSRAFEPPQSKPIDSALSDKRLDCLASIRNLLVHRAGKADSDYLENCERLKAIPKLKLGTSIELNGGMVKLILDGVIECCHNLIGGVDQYLLLKPPKNSALKHRNNAQPKRS